MKTLNTRTFGIPVSKEVPETVEEMVTLGVTEAQIVELAVSYVIEKNTLVQTRKAVLERLSEETGIERKTKVVGTNKDGSDRVAFAETETECFKRIGAEQNVDPTDAYADLVNEEFNNIPLDPTAKERSSKPKKLPQVHLDTAQEILDEGEEVATQVAAFLANLLNITVEPELESIARAVQEKDKRERAEKKNALVNAALAG